MNHKLTLASAVLLIAGGLFAEQALAAATGGIVVTAPRTVHREQVGKTNAGVPIEEVSLTRVVNTSDLDLSKVADRKIFEERVAFTAKEACQQLDMLYPPANFPMKSDDRQCYKEAVDCAMKQIMMR